MDINNAVTPKQISAAATVVIAIIEAVREAKRIPSGTVYTLLMTQGCTLSQFTALEAIALKSGMIARKGHQLVWIGPR